MYRFIGNYYCLRFEKKTNYPGAGGRRGKSRVEEVVGVG